MILMTQSELLELVEELVGHEQRRSANGKGARCTDQDGRPICGKGIVTLTSNGDVGVLSAFAPSGGWGTLPAHCGDWNGMRCSVCGSAAISERPERTTQGYRRYRCGNCGKQFNERSVGLLNRVQYPSDVIALVVLWRLRYKLSLRDLAEMFLTRGFIFSYEAVLDWEAKLTPAHAENLRRRRKARIGPSWYVDETYIRVCRADGSISIARSIATAP